jgi:hypothetical protein
MKPLAIVVCALAAAAVSVAQDTPEYGTTHLTYVQVAGSEFFPLVSGTGYTLTGTVVGQALRVGPGGGAFFSAPVHIPSGALIKYLELNYCDGAGGATGHEQLWLVESDKTGNITQVSSPLTSTVSACTSVNEDLTALGLVEDNLNKHHWLLGFFDGASNNGVAGAVIGYQLQVSPPPGSATFGDVPTSHPFFQYVEALAASGITGGCGSGNYCPDTPVTRGQMAVFLSKALGLQFQ